MSPSFSYLKYQYCREHRETVTLEGLQPVARRAAVVFMWLFVMAALVHTPAINVQDTLYTDIKRNFSNITESLFPDSASVDNDSSTRIIFVGHTQARLWHIVKIDVLEMFSATFWYHQLSLLSLLSCLSLVTLFCNRVATRELQERLLTWRVALAERGAGVCSGGQPLRAKALNLSLNCTSMNSTATGSSSSYTNSMALEVEENTQDATRSAELLADVKTLESELETHQLHVYVCWLYFGLWWLDTILAVFASHLMLQDYSGWFEVEDRHRHPYYTWVGLVANARVGLELLALLTKLFLVLRLDPLVRRAEWRRVRVLRHKLLAALDALVALISRALRLVCPKHDMNAGAGMVRRETPPDGLLDAETQSELEPESTPLHY